MPGSLLLRRLSLSFVNQYLCSLPLFALATSSRTMRKPARRAPLASLPVLRTHACSHAFLTFPSGGTGGTAPEADRAAGTACRAVPPAGTACGAVPPRSLFVFPSVPPVFFHPSPFSRKRVGTACQAVPLAFPPGRPS